MLKYDINRQLYYQIHVGKGYNYSYIHSLCWLFYQTCTYKNDQFT